MNLLSIIENIENKQSEANLILDFLKNQIKNSIWNNHIYIAGGRIRDELMGNDSKDIDLLISLENNVNPNQAINFANWITKKLKIYSTSNPVIYPLYGTAKFNLRGITYKGIDLSKVDIEVVAPRKEKYTFGNRKPTISAGTLKDDVDRRDFTVNSLLKNLTTGEILDLTGMGREDIKRGIIQTPLDPDIIFSEDPLRMMRAIRFSVKYGWKLPRFMLLSLKKNAHMIQHISKERIRDEFDKILISPNPDKGIRLIQWTGLSKWILPEWDSLVGLTQNKYHNQTVDRHILSVVKNVPSDLIARLIAAFHDIGKADTKSVIDGEVHFYLHEDIGADIAEKIMKRLKYPMDIINAVKLGIKNHMRLKGSGNEGEIISDKALRKLKFELGEHLENILDVMHADNISHSDDHSMPNQIPGIRKRLSSLSDIPKNQHIKLPVSGNDLIIIFGVRPGPIMKEILKAVEDEFFNNPDMTREEALQIVKDFIDEYKFRK